MKHLSKSEAQGNAEALVRREAPYTSNSAASFAYRWDYRSREPADLREAVRMVRRAYADEVPTKLHEGPDSIGEGGTPRMTARAEGYLFGSPSADDAGRDPDTGERDLVGYHHSPFRARLEGMRRGHEHERKRAAIVTRVVMGSEGPIAAAMAEGIPQWGAFVVAEDALRSFLRGMSALALHPRHASEVATSA